MKFIGGTPPDGIESRLARGCTIIFVELDGDLSGYIVLSDTVRDDSAQMLGQLARLGVQPFCSPETMREQPMPSRRSSKSARCTPAACPRIS